MDARHQPSGWDRLSAGVAALLHSLGETMMSQQSSRALTWVSAMFLGVALLVLSAMGSFACLVLASLCAAIPSLFGANRTRIIALCFLVLAIALAVWLFPQFQRELAAYSKRSRERTTALNHEPQLHS